MKNIPWFDRLNCHLLLRLFGGLTGIICSLIVITNSYAKSNASDGMITRLNRDIPVLLSKYHVPGASVIYVSEGRIFYRKGFGVKNIFTRAKIDTETVFEAGSNGKVLTAYICLKLVDEGKLNLDQPVADFLKKPWLQDENRSKRITARQLLAHTSGLSNAVELMDKKIYFEPGSKYNYSGVGFTYLQQIIEDVTGLPFEKAARKYVFTPFAMSSSTFGAASNSNTASPHLDAKAIIIYTGAPLLIVFMIIFILGFIIGILSQFRYYSKTALLKMSFLASFLADILILLLILSNLVMPLLILGFIFAAICILLNRILKKYNLAFGITLLLLVVLPFLIPFLVPIGKSFIPKVNPAFSLKTCGDDLGRFEVALLKEYQRNDKLMKEMFREQVAIDQNKSWGLGIGIDKSPAGITYWHSGINPGSQSLMVMDAKNNRGIVILTNSDNGLDFAKDTARLAFGINGQWDIKR